MTEHIFPTWKDKRMPVKSHWENTYASKTAEKLGWYKPHLLTSLRLIGATGADKTARVIDVGGGASTLVDDLLAIGFAHVTVLDVSATALSTARSRLGAAADRVRWLEGDIRTLRMDEDHYDIWHDRAVFHFLTGAEDRRRYVGALRRALRADGHVIMGTFSHEAPPRCSGLEVRRYTLELLCSELGAEFQPQEHKTEMHTTPGGVRQMYLYARFRRQDRPKSPAS